MTDIADSDGRVNSASDLLWGTEAIARIGRTKKQTQYLFEHDLLKSVRRVGDKYVASRSALLRELGAA